MVRRGSHESELGLDLSAWDDGHGALDVIGQDGDPERQPSVREHGLEVYSRLVDEHDWAAVPGRNQIME